MKNIAIILASGKGSRAGFNDLPKQFQKLYNKTVFEYSVSTFEHNENIDEIVVVINPIFRKIVDKIIKNNHWQKVKNIINGGEERIDSSYNGVFSIDEKEANILIHDCVRPFVTNKIINESIEALKKYDAVDVAVDVTDTIFVMKNGFMSEIPVRQTLKKSQTPQSFKLSLIKKAHLLAKEKQDIIFTDDCGLVLNFNLAPIFIVQGDNDNIKLTYKNDFELAKIILQKKH